MSFKGRQKGQTKARTTITDPLMGSYTISVEEDQYVLIDDKGNPQGYFTNLDSVIRRLSRILIAKQRTDYTLEGFVKEFNRYREVLHSAFPPIKNG